MYVEKQKHEVQQDLESHKTELRKSEIFFQKEFDAVTAFISLCHELLLDRRIPEMKLRTVRGKSNKGSQGNRG